MRKPNFITNIILVPLDFCLVVLAAISAYYFRFSESISQIRPVFYELPFLDYISLVIKVALLASFIFALSGFYTMRAKKLSRQLPQIISGVSLVLVILILAIFLRRELFSSRFIIILAWCLAIIYLFTARIIILLVRNAFLRHGYGLSGVVILGSPDIRKTIVEEYNKNLQWGYKVVGEFDNLAALEKSLGPSDGLKEKKVDHIMQSDSSLSKDDALDLLTFCQEHHLTLKYVANLFQAQSLKNINLIDLAGSPVVEIQGTPLDGWRKVLKRLFDFVLALVLLIILSPLLLILAILVKRSSPGEILVRLERVGLRGKVFKLYKFRSMIAGAERLKPQILQYNERRDGPLFKMKNDPRITSLGHWLRRTSLDELPQLFNVLKGDMSLVGPRPHEPTEVSQYQRGYKKLLTIRPGISGMAQVSGRSNLLFAEEAKLDIFYIENWSILLDIIILLKTLRVPFQSKEVY